MIEIETCHLVTIIMLIDLDRSHQLRLNLVDKVLKDQNVGTMSEYLLQNSITTKGKSGVCGGETWKIST